jgi:hypothetical protein
MANAGILEMKEEKRPPLNSVRIADTVRKWNTFPWRTGEAGLMGPGHNPLHRNK